MFRSNGIIDALSFLVLESTDIYGESSQNQIELFNVLAPLLCNISTTEAEEQNHDETTCIIEQCALRIFEYIYNDSIQGIPQIGIDPGEYTLTCLV